MSEPAAATTSSTFWDRLPPRLRPLEKELHGRGNLRLIETTLLVIVGVVLALATINDVSRQTGINQRLIADLKTWRSYTAHDYKNVGVSQELLGITTHRDVVCGNTTAGPPKARSQICLVVAGPDQVRQARGARGLVSAAEHRRRRERTPLRLLRCGHGRALPEMSALAASGAPAGSARRALPGWWPLAALTLLAAVLRLSTLDLQSFWYDEAFTPVHVLHQSLSADVAGGLALGEQPAAVVPHRVGRLSHSGQRRVRSAPALGARGDRRRPGLLGDRQDDRRTSRGDRRSGARRGEPAVRLVLPGGSRLRPVRVHGGARRSSASCGCASGPTGAGPQPSRWPARWRS